MPKQLRNEQLQKNDSKDCYEEKKSSDDQERQIEVDDKLIGDDLDVQENTIKRAQEEEPRGTDDKGVSY